MAVLPIFGSLLQGFNEQASAIKQQRLDQENRDRQFKASTLQYFLNHPDTPSDVRNQAGSMLVDMAMDHLGYKPTTKQARPLEKLVDQFVGTMNQGPDMSQLGRGPGQGTGNSQSSVGGLSQPAGQQSSQPSTLGQGSLTPPPTQAPDTNTMPPSMQMEANRQPGQLLIPGLGAARSVEQAGATAEVQRKAYADQIAAQHDATYNFLTQHVPDMSEREKVMRSIGGFSSTNGAIMGTPTQGTISGAELMKELGSDTLPSGNKIDQFSHYKTWTGMKGDGTRGVTYAEPADALSGATKMTAYDDASKQWVQILVDTRSNPPRIVPGFKELAPPSFANMTSITNAPHVMKDAAGNEFMQYATTTNTREPNQTPSNSGMTPLPGQTATPAPPTKPQGKSNVTPGLGPRIDIPGAVGPSGTVSVEKYSNDKGAASNIDNSIRLFAGTADGSFKGTFQLNALLDKLVSAAKVAAAENAEGVSVGTLVSRYGKLTPDEEQLAANLISMKEDLPGALRGIFGAPVARGSQMLKVMQDQAGSLLGSPEVLKKVQQNTLRTLLRNRAAKEIPIATYDAAQGTRPKGQILPSNIKAQDDLFHAYVMATGSIKAAKNEMEKDGWK